jgi:hypothetical protein
MRQRIRTAWRTALATALAICVVTGCTSSKPDALLPHVLPTPSSGDDCGESTIQNFGDGSIRAGIWWPGGDFRVGESAVVYACFHPRPGTGRVRPSTPDVVVSPATFATDEASAGVAAIHVKSTGVLGSVDLRFTLVDSDGEPYGDIRAACTIQSDGQRWHFSKPSY